MPTYPPELFFDSAEDVDLYCMGTALAGYYDWETWWEYWGDQQLIRRRLRWLIDPWPPHSAPNETAFAGVTMETLATALCAKTSQSRGTDTATACVRRCLRVAAGYTPLPNN